MDYSKILALLLNLLVQKSDDPIVTDQIFEEYDFIVVGAGTSGSVVASRLSEIEGITVLVLEAGDTDLGNSLIKLPYEFNTLQKTPVDWNYDLADQKNSMFEMEKPVKYPRGKVLGGSSSINALFYLRGSPHDFDSWEDHGAKGWGWKDVEFFYKKLENAASDDMSPNVGRGGPLNLTRLYKTPMYEKLIEAGKEIGIKEVDYFEDVEGITRATATQYAGLRHSSSDAYLRQVYAERKDRLHIVTMAHVSKVLLDKDSFGKIRVKGVKYLKNNKIKSVKARKEIILSAGAFGTPQILMLSGIGPKNHLEEMKIKVVLDAPGVGSNMEDHFALMSYYKMKSSDYYGQTSSSMEEYIVNGTGSYASVSGTDCFLHHRTKYFGTNISLSSSKRPFPEMGLQFIPNPLPYPFSMKENPEFHSCVLMFFQHPKSKGTIRLKSTDPLDQPVIDPNFLSNEDDVKIIEEGFRQLEKFEMAKTMKEIGYSMITPDICGGAIHNKVPRSSEFYECYMKAFNSAWHACCTAKMGSDDDDMAVVDERLKVRGIEGLRISDASVMPHETSSNTQAPCYMIGEKASHMIKKDWSFI